MPALEVAAAMASPIADLGVEVVSWQETQDPYVLTGSLLPGAQQGPSTTICGR